MLASWKGHHEVVKILLDPTMVMKEEYQTNVNARNSVSDSE